MRAPVMRLLDERGIFTREWLPSSESNHAVLCLHGSESHSEWFADVAELLAVQGFVVNAFDQPGWGESAGTRGHLARAADAIARVINAGLALRERFARVHLAGLSWGGLLAVCVALREPNSFDSVTLIAPGIYPKFDLTVAQKIRVVLDLFKKRARRFSLPFAPGDFTQRSDKQRYIENDSRRVTSVTSGFCFATFQMQRFARHRATRLARASVLLAGADALIDNAATRELLGEKAAISLYENAAHSLVLEEPERVTADISRNALGS